VIESNGAGDRLRIEMDAIFAGPHHWVFEPIRGVYGIPSLLRLPLFWASWASSIGGLMIWIYNPRSTLTFLVQASSLNRGGHMSNDVDKMTRKSQEAMQAAAVQAEGLSNPYVEPEHLLTQLLLQSEGLVPRIIEKAQVADKSTSDRGGGAKILIEELKNRVAKFPQITGTKQRPAGSGRLQKVFMGAEAIAREFGDSYVSTEHFLLSMIQSSDSDLQNLFKKALP
jgi:hypothetical protein